MSSPKYELLNTVTLSQAPESYSGKRIGLVGDYIRVHENHSIGLTGIPRKRVNVGMTDKTKLIGVEDSRQYMETYVVAFGRYQYGACGHLGMFMGELQRIWSIFSLEEFLKIEEDEKKAILVECDLEQAMSEQIGALTANLHEHPLNA